MLRDFAEKYNEEGIEEIYRNMPDERKVLIEPVTIGVIEKLEAWNREEYELYTGFVLYQYKDDIEYKT